MERAAQPRDQIHAKKRKLEPRGLPPESPNEGVNDKSENKFSPRAEEVCGWPRSRRAWATVMGSEHLLLGLIRSATSPTTRKLTETV